MAKSSTKIITSPIVRYPGTVTSMPLVDLHNDEEKDNIHDISRSLREVSISVPQAQSTPSGALKANIILVAKYEFSAENENELSVKQGDVLKLIDRPGNGWLLVKFIDKVLPPGLVPACYVDIALNDPKNPVTLNWLQSSQQSSSSLFNEQSYLQISLKQGTGPPLTINNKAYPISVSISNFLLYNQRYWYRLDIIKSDNTKVYVCRYYQDFYNLHVELLHWLNNQPLEDSLKLPKLPEPIPSKDEQDQIPLLLKRCNDLNVYINKLVLNKNYQLNDIVIEWLSEDYNGLPGFSIMPHQVLDNDDINEKMLPGSVNVLKDYNEQKRTTMEDTLEEEDPVHYSPLHTGGVGIGPAAAGFPQRTKSRKNIFNNYQQGSVYRSQSGKDISRNKSTHSSSGRSSRTSNKDVSRTTSSASTFSKKTEINPYKVGSPISSYKQPYRSSDESVAPYVSPYHTSDEAYKQQPYVDSTEPPSVPYSNPYSPKLQSPNKPFPSSSPYSPKMSNPVQYSPKAIFTSPYSPQISRSSPSVSSSSLKCNVTNFNEDLVVVKINKSVIKTVVDFKRSLKQKVFFSRLYIKMPDSEMYQNVDDVGGLSDYIKSAEEVDLKIT